MGFYLGLAQLFSFLIKFLDEHVNLLGELVELLLNYRLEVAFALFYFFVALLLFFDAALLVFGLHFFEEGSRLKTNLDLLLCLHILQLFLTFLFFFLEQALSGRLSPLLLLGLKVERLGAYLSLLPNLSFALLELQLSLTQVYALSASLVVHLEELCEHGMLSL